MIDDPVFLQEGLPSQCPQQEIHPHGQNKYKYDKAVLIYVHMCQNHGQRIGQKEADQSAGQRKAYGEPEGFRMFRAHHGEDVFQSKGSCPVRQPKVKYHAKGDKDKDRFPEQIRGRQQPAGDFIILQFRLPPRLQIPVCS